MLYRNSCVSIECRCEGRLCMEEEFLKLLSTAGAVVEVVVEEEAAKSAKGNAVSKVPREKVVQC